MSAPISDRQLKYLNSAKVGDTLIVEITYVPSRAAKRIFDYKIYRESDHELLTTARTIQLFQSLDGTFEVSNPDFFLEWKKRWNQ